MASSAALSSKNWVAHCSQDRFFQIVLNEHCHLKFETHAYILNAPTYFAKMLYLFGELDQCLKQKHSKV